MPRAKATAAPKTTGKEQPAPLQRKYNELKEKYEAIQEEYTSLELTSEIMKSELDKFRFPCEIPETMESAHKKIIDLFSKINSRDLPFMLWRVISDVKTLQENKRREINETLRIAAKEMETANEISYAFDKVTKGDLDFMNLT